jgi:hypothetical protein
MSHICLKHGSFYLLPVTGWLNLVEKKDDAMGATTAWRIWRIYGAFLQTEKPFSYILCWRVWRISGAFL